MNNNNTFYHSNTHFLIYRSWLYVCVFLINLTTLQAQTYRFQQNIRNKQVGTLIAKKTIDAAGTHYVIDSDVTFNYGLGKIKVIYHAEAHYENEQMVQSKVRVEKNGKLRDYSETWKNEDEYLARIDGEKVELPWKEIEYSSLMLYLDEPKGIDSIYSEAHGKKNLLIHEGGGHYKVDVTGNKNINKYRYVKGILNSAVLDHWLAAIHLKLIEKDGQKL